VAYRAQNPAADDLLVIDGPLRGRTHLDRAVGYIKSHHASYLPPDQAAIVSALRGEDHGEDRRDQGDSTGEGVLTMLAQLLRIGQFGLGHRLRSGAVS